MQYLVGRDVDAKNPQDLRHLLIGTALTELQADAEQFDFVPWAISGREPRGKGFRRWRAEFLARHDRRWANANR